MKTGDIIKGEITAIKNYGLFIKINGMHALLHISEIGDKHIDNLCNKFQIGQKIIVKIRHIDIKQGRISVSTRDLI